MLSSQSSSSSSVTFLDVLCCCGDAVLFSSGISSFKGSRKVKRTDLKIWKQFHTSSLSQIILVFNTQLTQFKHNLSFLKNSESYSKNSSNDKKKKGSLIGSTRAMWLPSDSKGARPGLQQTL